jgi:hypothetical protein
MLAAAAAFAVSPAWADLAAADKAYGTLLLRYITPRGVKYPSWRASGSDLKTISEIAMIYRSTDPKPLEPNARKALYINLYNAKLLETVLLDNPKNSIKELSKGPNSLEIFNRPVMIFDEKRTSLSSLQNRLRDEFKDPRVHFALNCASRSCPPIRPEVYLAETLDAQLDEATRSFLASPGAVLVNRSGGKVEIVVAKLFDRYADDFKASGGTLAFISKFGPESAAAAIAGGKAKLSFADHDWRLNVAK